MEASTIILWMIGACVVFFMALILSKPLKIIIKVIIRAVLGLTGVFLGNIILAPFGLSVGINILTGFIIGVLGIPGFILLYLSYFFL